MVLDTKEIFQLCKLCRNQLAGYATASNIIHNVFFYTENLLTYTGIDASKWNQ